MQWLIATLVYAGIVVLLVAGVRQSWMQAGALRAWTGFVVIVQLVSYVALRGGWSASAIRRSASDSWRWAWSR